MGIGTEKIKLEFWYITRRECFSFNANTASFWFVSVSVHKNEKATEDVQRFHKEATLDR